jgi:hypothetical protein
MYANQANPRLCLVNANDRYYTIRKGTVVGESVSVEPVELYQQDQQDDRGEGTALTSPLQLLVDKAGKQLINDHKETLEKCIGEYQDVFARDEFDLGNFTETEHSIDPGTARPIKQRMRRTPMIFAQEEESHLQKMLDAGVIEPSISEWASPPVLIREWDVNVRWCIDYRKLNLVTKKDIYPLPLIEECIATLSGFQSWTVAYFYICP